MGLIKDVPVRHRMRFNINLTAFTDEIHTSVGSAAFILSELLEGTGHDWFSSEDLVIRTAAGGGGTLLVLNTDYVVLGVNSDRTTEATAAAGTTKTICLQIQITNAAYQACALYFSGKYWGDYADPEDLNNLTRRFQAKSGDFTVGELKGNEIFNVTTATSAVVATMCTIAGNLNTEKTFVKVDSGTGCLAILDATGALVALLQKQWQRITIKDDGTSWVLIEGRLRLYPGYIQTADWTNRHFGLLTINYTGKSGTIGLGRYVTEATSGNKAIVIYDSGTALTCAGVIENGSGWTNARTITSDSGGTATINGSTKDVDSNIRHGWGRSLNQIKMRFMYSTDRTDNNSKEVGTAGYDSNTGSVFSYGFGKWQVDTNTIKLHTAAHGVVDQDDSGTPLILDTENYAYEITLEAS